VLGGGGVEKRRTRKKRKTRRKKRTRIERRTKRAKKINITLYYNEN